MTFDKSKAMRNAERFIAQGKIRSAIDEYTQVVKHDPRDYGTMNMLGDLHFKESNKDAAVRYFTQVAEYYARQGFSQKAIAIYNKIARIKPDSPEVSEKLAELYKSKGSVSEAKSHYTTLAEHYLSKGYRTEAYAIWKQIGLLDPNNTQVFITLAEAYLEDNQLDEAAEAYCEAAGRFSRAGDHTTAVDSLNKALTINASNVNCLNAFVRELTEIGRAEDAVERLEDILRTNPRNREVARLLIDCHISCGRPDDAEAVLVKLVESEPANSGKFLELVSIYIERGEAASAGRALTMCSEHMLMGGQSEELSAQINSILELDPNELASMRLLARFFSWKRDRDGLQETLVRMASVAKTASSVDDERYALSQLTILVPHQTEFSDRLDELNKLHGFVENPFDNRIIQEQFAGEGQYQLENDFAIAGDENVTAVDHHIERNGHTTSAEMFDAEIADLSVVNVDVVEDEILTPKYETELDKELESIRFYIENEYFELASRTLEELQQRFGSRPEFSEIALRLDSAMTAQSSGAKPLDIAEIRNEFGIEDIDPVSDTGDYDTHYQMGIAYQEMGLTEEAIKEYQDAVALVRPNDGTKRFFQCANLLGHCFMESGMANLASRWYGRALETSDLNEDEKQGIWYELARAYEAEGDVEKAGRYFEQVYAENVDYRDVGECLKRLAVEAA